MPSVTAATAPATTAAALEPAALEKAPSGIPGFDEITLGGLPRGRTTLLIGGPGAGKTIFALKYLANGARECEEPGIFVAFEESSRQLLANAATFGWGLRLFIAQAERVSLRGLLAASANGASP